MMKGLLSLRDKGVTPVIAIIMLLLIVVVMVGGVFAWMQTMQEDVEGMTEEQLSGLMEEVKESIKIENYQCSGDDIEKIYVRNSDDVNKYNVSVYVNGGLALENVQLKPNTLHELVEDGEGNIDNTLDKDVKRGDTLSIGSKGEIVQSETFSC
ncbi:MAG: archaellin/type IV pilin N-terminal domain-containing protein [Candidatus Aenigmatarchaeota archaeon]